MNELLLCSNLLSLPERLDLVAVVEGLKPIARLLVRPSNVNSLRAIAIRLQLIPCGTGIFAQRRCAVLGGTLVDLVDRPSSYDADSVVYVVRRGEEKVAQELLTLERGIADDEQIGLALGYPPCCAATYQATIAEGNWLRCMLEATPTSDAPFAACNRLARLFGDWAVLPDYYPCSFACRASRQLAERLCSAAEQHGLREELHQAWQELCRPMRVTDREVLQCSAPPRVAHIDGPGISPRVLAWRR